MHSAGIPTLQQSWFMVYIFVCIYIEIHSIYSTCNVLIYSCFFLWKIRGFGVPLLGLFTKSWKLDAVAIGKHHKGVFKQQPCGIGLTGTRASRTTHGHGPKWTAPQKPHIRRAFAVKTTIFPAQITPNFSCPGNIWQHLAKNIQNPLLLISSHQFAVPSPVWVVFPNLPR